MRFSDKKIYGTTKIRLKDSHACRLQRACQLSRPLPTEPLSDIRPLNGLALLKTSLVDRNRSPNRLGVVKMFPFLAYLGHRLP
jgi:hypothetical protein